MIFVDHNAHCRSYPSAFCRANYYISASTIAVKDHHRGEKRHPIYLKFASPTSIRYLLKNDEAVIVSKF